MSLTHEQRYLLEELREYLRRVEKMAARYEVDLDEFEISYKQTGYRFGANEKSTTTERSGRRKDIFERAGRQETVNYYLPEEE